MTERPLLAIADDDAMSRELLAEALRPACEVRTFADGESLLHHLAAQAVDLVLLDVDMPGLSGYETCRRLRTSPTGRDLPVLFLSVHGLPQERLQGYAAGGNDYLNKPVHLDELVVKVQLAIDAHRHARQLTAAAAHMGDAAAVTAEMMGEIGVVLDFQRSIAGCADADEVAGAMVDALARFRLDGCLQLQARDRLVVRSTGGVVSALEASLLNHLASRGSERIVTMGSNLGFAYGGVTVLVRSLVWTVAAEDAATIDAMGRARDNVALLVEGAMARLRAIDVELDARQLAHAQEVIAATRRALSDQQAASRQMHDELDAIFDAVRTECEAFFPVLGLTLEQEERLLAMVAQQHQRGLAVLARSRRVEQGLHALVRRMSASQPALHDT